MTDSLSLCGGAVELSRAADLRQVLRLLESAQLQFRADVAADVGVSLSELAALELIHDVPGLTPTMLARELSVTTGTATALLDRLGKAEWVDRLPNPRDQRSVLLHLTGSGRTVFEQVVKRYEAASIDVAQASPKLSNDDIVEELGRAAAVVRGHSLRDRQP